MTETVCMYGHKHSSEVQAYDCTGGPIAEARWIVESASESRMLAEISSEQYCRELERAVDLLRSVGADTASLGRRIRATRAGVPLPGNHPV